MNVLRDKLIAAAGGEVTTFYYYTLRRANAIGLEGKALDTSWAIQPWTRSNQGRQQRAIRRKRREEKDRRV